MQDRVSRLSRVAIFAAILVTAASCSDDGIEEVREPGVRPVKLLTLTAASDLETSRYPAVVDAGRFNELSFQVGGQIEKLAVDEAQQVRAGDFIAQLDQRDFKSQVASARAQFQNAEDEYQRAVQMKQAIARNVLEQRLTERDVARAQLDTAEKALEDTVLRVPFNGVIAQVPVRERQTVSAGQPVVVLIDLSTLEVSVNLPARIIAESQQIENLGTFVMLEAAPDVRIPATFKEANLLADTASQTYAVTFTFKPLENLVILPGMNATVEFEGARRAADAATDRKSVPLTAIVGEGDSTYVWLVDQDSMTVSKRKVAIVDGIGEFAIVTEGLAAGDVIAVAGASFLAEGMQVRDWGQ